MESEVQTLVRRASELHPYEIVEMLDALRYKRLEVQFLLCADFDNVANNLRKEVK